MCRRPHHLGFSDICAMMISPNTTLLKVVLKSNTNREGQGGGACTLELMFKTVRRRCEYQLQTSKSFPAGRRQITCIVSGLFAAVPDPGPQCLADFSQLPLQTSLEEPTLLKCGRHCFFVSIIHVQVPRAGDTV